MEHAQLLSEGIPTLTRNYPSWPGEPSPPHASATVRRIVISLRESLRRGPDLPLTEAVFGEFALIGGYDDQAAAALQRAEDLGRPVDGVAVPLALALLRSGRYQDAVDAATVDAPPARRAVLLTLQARALLKLSQVGDIVLPEVLHGARDAQHALGIERRLRAFPVLRMPGAPLAIGAAANHRLLRSLGITIRKAADLIIGAYCIEYSHELLHNDQDFERMRVHLGSQVV